MEKGPPPSPAPELNTSVEDSADKSTGKTALKVECSLYLDGLVECIAVSNQLSHLYKYSSLDPCGDRASRLTDCLQFKLRFKSSDEIKHLREAAERSKTIGVIWQKREKPSLFEA